MRFKVVYEGASEIDVVNGITTASQIGFADATLALTGASTEVTALNMADDTIHTTYTVKVVLAAAKSANTLSGLDFTAQISDNDTDKKVYRALNDENQFHAYVDQQSNGTIDLGNINLYVPASLSDHAEDYDVNTVIDYYNVVTGFEVPEGAVAYIVTDRDGSGNVQMTALDAITETADVLNGTVIASDNEIVVIPEQIARQFETGTIKLSNGTTSQLGWAGRNVLEQYGTIYTVNIVTVNSSPVVDKGTSHPWG